MIRAASASDRALPARVHDVRAPSRSRLSLLGGFELAIDGAELALGSRARRLVAFLALRSYPVSRDFVAGSLWPDATDARADGNLRSALWSLGRATCPLVAIRAGSLALDRAVSVDLARGVAVAQALLRDRPEISEGDLDEGLLTRDLLPDWYEDWVLEAQEPYRQLRLHALEAACRHLTALRSFSRAVQAGLAAVAAEPLRESAQRALIRAYLAEGNRCEARRQYRAFRDLLASELDLEPSAETRQLIGGPSVAAAR